MHTVGWHRETLEYPSLRSEGIKMVPGACTLRHVQSEILKAPSCLFISSVPQELESNN